MLAPPRSADVATNAGRCWFWACMYAADLVSVLANKSTWSSFRKPFFAAALVRYA